jgi:perosamine synthetase
VQCLRTGFIGNGELAKALEIQICARTGRKYAFAVSSGFHALLLALRALDLKLGSNVCLPVLTCASVLAVVQNAGHCAVLADVEVETLTLNVNELPEDTEAVIAPHAYGAPVDAVGLQRRGLPWIEDCATSPATSVGHKPAGSSGTLSIFSFASTKYITGGSGGVVACDSDILADRVEDLLNFDIFEKHGQWNNGWHGALPGRMADLNASLAKVQLERMIEFSNRRRAIAEIYDARLRGSPGLKLMELRPEHTFYRYIIHTQKPSEELRAKLFSDGIDARSSVNPWLDRIPAMCGKLRGGPWPVAEKWRGNLLSLPIYPSLSDDDAESVAESLLRADAS